MGSTYEGACRASSGQSDRDIGEAHTIMAAGIARQAARLFYLAQFHAAQALIFERTGKTSKTHKGVRTQFHLLAKTEVSLDQGLTGNLTAAFQFKEAVDYELGYLADIAPADAAAAMTAAEHFIAEVKRVRAASPVRSLSPTTHLTCHSPPSRVE